jgi:biotin carboxyl carrier protein
MDFQTPDGKRRSVARSGQSAHIVERRYDLAEIEQVGARMSLLINGERVSLHIVERAGVTFIALNGKIIRLERAKPGAVQRAASGGDLTATMPGQVTQILVEVGQQVTTGQTLLLLEAMKMETRITAPRDGIVARILCAVGETVQGGQVLVEIAGDER